MASESDGAELADEEIAGLTDAELVGRSRSIYAEIRQLWQACFLERPEEERTALVRAAEMMPVPAPGGEALFEQRRRIEHEIGLRLGQMLRGARLVLGLTRKDVGKVAGMHSKFVDEIEQGRRPWSTNPDFFERACTEGRFGRDDCTRSLSLWFPLTDPRICRTIREVVVDPAWLTSNDGAVATLARSIREGRDFDLLPILGDAIEEAGCTDIDILTHCRGVGEHARGCWVVDALVRAGRGESSPRDP